MFSAMGVRHFRRVNLTGKLTFAAIALFGTVSACADTTSPHGSATVRILLTDAPADYIESAHIWISHVYLVPGEEGSGEVVDLFNNPENPLMYDLMLLRDGITGDLTGDVTVEAVQYHQLRMIVDSATVVVTSFRSRIRRLVC